MVFEKLKVGVVVVLVVLVVVVLTLSLPGLLSVALPGRTNGVTLL